MVSETISRRVAGRLFPCCESDATQPKIGLPAKRSCPGVEPTRKSATRRRSKNDKKRGWFFCPFYVFSARPGSLSARFIRPPLVQSESKSSPRRRRRSDEVPAQIDTVHRGVGRSRCDLRERRAIVGSVASGPGSSGRRAEQL